MVYAFHESQVRTLLQIIEFGQSSWYENCDNSAFLLEIMHQMGKYKEYKKDSDGCQRDMVLICTQIWGYDRKS